MTPDPYGTSEVAALRGEVEQLRDLFLRRLYDDRTKNRLFEVVEEQLKQSQALLTSKALEVFIQECLLVIDRLLTSDGSDDLLHLSAADELLEVFRRRGLQRVSVAEGFDPRFHQIIGTEAARRDDEIDAVLAVHRDGYTLNERLLRPAQVVIAVRART